MSSAVPETPKATLLRYLTRERDAMLWKLDGLSDYDVRRPLTPTGTNLLGLLKHTASVAVGYLGDTFGRPFPVELSWLADDADPNLDMWAGADESRADIEDLWTRAWAHCDATVEALDLDAVGQVPWWPPERATVTLHLVLVHLIAEVCRHAGHADIVRELIDGAAGIRQANSNLPDGDAEFWTTYRDRLQAVAEKFRAP